MQTNPLNDARTVALQEMDTAEKRVKQAIFLAASIETVMLGAFLYVMDFSSRQDWLLLIAALLVYATLAAGLLALGLKLRLGVLQVLKAIELLSPHQE